MTTLPNIKKGFELTLKPYREKIHVLLLNCTQVLGFSPTKNKGYQQKITTKFTTKKWGSFKPPHKTKK
jgi:hypothetical protein